ncbi:DUF2058 domain-containing protein [Aestuariirhabdus sp. Z084]|uniref:DUF2058 domain-containing protein n=1 Tax=Aestuariirhabdus haliotis TaxID=2918751 RepID=UPI00201B3EEA|nr:DUF2058 domain-containing protein [Aestuariirhabdus haliotis]MCL6415940.1 DUF2058 domain-containing protein [Aestuariirhabdus haliotis]MCL6419938.1 DUF2058 domain-containing protein [Aestuariirhabdus haliotis]
MSGSLRDQLLKQGLVNKKQVQQAQKADKRKARDNRKSEKVGEEVAVDEARLQAQQAREQKKLRDREANLKREEQRKEKELVAQVKQIIERNAIQPAGEIDYNFVVAGKIKKIGVDAMQQKALSGGRLAIVELADRFVLIPVGAADKIAQRLPETILSQSDNNQEEPDPDDPYADFQIPDDLMW